MTRWGKAGVRLTDKEAEQRGRRATASRSLRQHARAADDRIAYRLWRAGELRPYLITHALDARSLYGPEVDVACGATEPDVDLWEAGKLYPTWAQLLRLAALCEVTPRLLCTKRDLLTPEQTSMRFHGWIDDRPRVWAFERDAALAAVGDAAFEMPEEV